MSTDLIPFSYEGHQVRAIQIDGEPWLVAADICGPLGYRKPSDAARHVDAEDRRVIDSADVSAGPFEGARSAPSGSNLRQSVTLVNESGLYSLILRSRLEEAKKFKRWVTNEVLPAIRKTGRYEIQSQQHEIPQTLADALEFAAKKVRALEAAEARNAELEPDAARAKRTMDAHGLALVGTVAKRFGIKETALRQFLHAEGLLIRDGNRRNEPYARYIESGHFELKTRLVGADPDRAPQERSTTFVTPKGEALIWKRLYDAGYVSSPIQPPRQLELVLGGGAPPVLPLGPTRTPGGAA